MAEFCYTIVIYLFGMLMGARMEHQSNDEIITKHKTVPLCSEVKIGGETIKRCYRLVKDE